MQIVPTAPVAQPTPNTAPQPAITVGPASPAAPIEPARRVTANRDTGRSDLVPHQTQRAQASLPNRGRLLDLDV
ncbi:MAG TPA: hypothetical protein VET85_12140 [Stellaceae bacterium]|nr:hypothetical protein [Stellaceae bacterium]